MTFSKKLTLLRKRAGLSQDQLAEMLDVSRQSVSKWEGQQTLPETAKAIAIANIFNVSLDVLLRDELELDETPAGNLSPVPPEEKPRRRLLICVLGGVALLLSAALLIGALSLTGHGPSTPPAGIGSSQQDASGLPSRETSSGQTKFNHYIRKFIMSIKGQNNTKEGPGHGQIP